MEVFSKISIANFSRHMIGPVSKSVWLIEVILVPDNPFDVMEGIEGFLQAASRLLDAGELGNVLEPICAIGPFTFLLGMEGASICGVGIYSLIEDTLYSGQVHPRLPRNIRRV